MTDELAAPTHAQDGVRRRVGAAAAALVLGIVLVAAPGHDTIRPGRPGDGPSLTGFGERATYRGLPGRWTRGLGQVAIPASPLPADVTIQLQADAVRGSEAVDVYLDGTRLSGLALAAGRQAARVAVPGCARLSGCGVRRLTLQSPPWTDASSGETRGVFVSGVEIARGGVDADGRGRLARTPLAAWLAALALAAGLAAAAWRLSLSDRVAWIACLWGSAALLLFRAPLAPHWPLLALACVVLAALHAGIRSRFRVRGDARRRARLQLAGFLAGAIALVALLFVETVTRGAVFGQPQMLAGYYPWRAYLPATWELGPTPPLGDVPMLVYPFLAFTRERLLEGHLPLWTASLNAGQPFLAAYQAAVFSPLTWVALAVPLPQATVVIAFLRLLVGGVGMFVFIRGLGLSPGASLVAGTAYLLNPFEVLWLEHPPGGVPPFLPWMLHAATRCAAARRFGPAGLAAATALVVLGGHPHTGLFCAALASAWGFAKAASGPDRWRRLASVAGALVVGVAIAAIQIAPFLEYLFASRGYTARQFSGLNPLAAPTATLITALVPRFLGEHWADTYAGPLNYLEQTIYAGIPILVLAVVGIAAPSRRQDQRGRDWRAGFFAAIAALATLAVYGAPGVLQVISALPLVKGATLTRIPIVAITAVIVVAAFGVDALARSTGDGDRRRAALAALAASGAIAGAILWTLAAQGSFLLRSALTADTWRWSLWALLLAAGTALVITGFGRRLLPRRAAVAAITALVALDLFVAGRGFHRTQPAADVYPVLPEIARLQAEAGPFRVAGAKGALMPNSALVYGLQDIRAYDGLGVAWYMDLLDVALAWAPAHQQHELHAVDTPLLDLLGVRYVLAPPDLAVDAAHYARVPDTAAPLYRNRRERPRAFLADGYVVATGNDARRRLRDAAVDTRRDVLLDAEPDAAGRPERAPTADAIGTARITAYEHERVAIDTDAPARRWLVLTDTFFPGWRATVDGQPIAIARANFAFRAVPLAVGRHHVVFEYVPASFRIGAAISSVALVFVAVWTAAAERRQRRAPLLAASA